MDYEQKFKEALSFLKDLKPHMSDYCIEKLEGFFSKLKESEDEKIRKEIIDYLKNFIPHHDCDLVSKSKVWLSWLEKQGEQMSDPRYSILDKLIEADDIYQMSVNDAMAEEAKNKAIEALSKLEISKLLWLEKQGERKPAWSEEDEDIFNNIIAELELVKKDVGEINYPSYDRLINWLKSFKDRVQPQPKQEWGEEDEKRLLQAITALEGEGEKYLKDYGEARYKDIVTWLKSIKPNHWKPSEKEMDDLSYAAEALSVTLPSLKNLYEHLKAI